MEASDERREGRRLALERERVRVEVGDVEDLGDESRQPVGDTVDTFDVGAFRRGIQVEVEEGVGVPPDQGERRAELVADRRDEALAELLECTDGADVAQDRGRRSPRARLGVRRPTRSGVAGG